MESADWHIARAQLEWLIELGADEAITDAPIDRYALPDKQTKPKAPAQTASPLPVSTGAIDPVAAAQTAADAAQTLSELRAAMESFEHCELKRGAKNLVFSDGDPAARVMIIGEAPGREEDRLGKPFVGAAGQLLDKMFGAIGMDRNGGAAPLYITNTLPWRPPQNRDPKPEEIAMLKPFLLRHIELAAPEVLVLMGNWACQALLEKRGILRLRGNWTEAAGRPALPMTHPAYLLRTPSAKRDAWADLLSLKSRLNG